MPSRESTQKRSVSGEQPGIATSSTRGRPAGSQWPLPLCEAPGLGKQGRRTRGPRAHVCWVNDGYEGDPQVRDTAGAAQTCWASDLAPRRCGELGQLCCRKSPEQTPPPSPPRPLRVRPLRRGEFSWRKACFPGQPPGGRDGAPILAATPFGAPAWTKSALLFIHSR